MHQTSGAQHAKFDEGDARTIAIVIRSARRLPHGQKDAVGDDTFNLVVFCEHSKRGETNGIRFLLLRAFGLNKRVYARVQCWYRGKTVRIGSTGGVF